MREMPWCKTLRYQVLHNTSLPLHYMHGAKVGSYIGRLLSWFWRSLRASVRGIELGGRKKVDGRRYLDAIEL
jgi:hypothetical protein